MFLFLFYRNVHEDGACLPAFPQPPAQPRGFGNVEENKILLHFRYLLNLYHKQTTNKRLQTLNSQTNCDYNDANEWRHIKIDYLNLSLILQSNRVYLNIMHALSHLKPAQLYKIIFIKQKNSLL